MPSNGGPRSSSPRPDEHILPALSGKAAEQASDLTQKLSKQYFKKDFGKLQKAESNVLTMLAERRSISRDMYEDSELKPTFGNRLADKVARIGGSWLFMIFSAIFVFAWMALNSILLAHVGKPFDPYPYTALNLVLSMVAAFQAPVIMMSQNRQAAHDRLDASHDYEINLKADLEILNLHEKLDELRNDQWKELVNIQQRQIDMLMQLVKSKEGDTSSPKS